MESRPCNKPPYNPKLQDKRSDSCLVLCVDTRAYLNARHLPISRLDQPYDLHKKATTSYYGRWHFCCFRKDMLEEQLGVDSSTNVQQTQVMCKHCNVYLCVNDSFYGNLLDYHQNLSKLPIYH